MYGCWSLFMQVCAPLLWKHRRARRALLLCIQPKFSPVHFQVHSSKTASLPDIYNARVGRYLHENDVDLIARKALS